MAIDELLTKACYWITAAEDKETPLDEAAQCAQIAQAAAQTAQAMDFHRYVDAWIAMGDLVDAREYDNTPEM